MPRVDARTVRRSLARRTPALVGAVLAAGLAVVLGVTPGLAAAPAVTRAVTDPTDVRTPGGDPTDETTPPVEPTATGPAPTGAPPTLPPDPEPTTPAPEPTGTTPETTAPAPTATSAPTATPTPKPPLPSRSARPPGPNPDQPGGDRVGVQVTTGDITLDDRYWRDPSTVATLRVTVTNTGLVPERLRLEYRLPAGLTDAGTPGCAAAGDGWQCGEWTTAPGDRFTGLIRVRVGGTAWRQMPLSGAVRVTATGPDAGDTAQDNEGFAVLFPPGPPVPGILLVRRGGGVRHQRWPHRARGPPGQHRQGGRRRTGRGAVARRGQRVEPTGRLHVDVADAYPLRPGRGAGGAHGDAPVHGGRHPGRPA